MRFGGTIGGRVGKSVGGKWGRRVGRRVGRHGLNKSAFKFRSKRRKKPGRL